MATRKKNVLSVIFASIVLFSILFPFYIMIISSTYTSATIYKAYTLLPGSSLVRNYNLVMRNGIFYRYLFNSIYTSTLKTLITIVISLLAGFSLSKYQFKGKKIFVAFIMLTLMLPVVNGIVALLWEMRVMGWSNTHLPIIFVGVANSFVVFWLKQALDDVPYEIIESARIDGCKELNLLFSIVTPLIKPAIMTIAILTFIESYNDFVLPSVVLNTSSLYTIPVGIAQLNNLYSTENAAKILGTMLGTLPVLLLYFFMSKQVINGLSSGAVKG